MSHTTAYQRYQAARARVKAAQEACVHWDYEHSADGGQPCCYEHTAALQERAAARLEYLKDLSS